MFASQPTIALMVGLRPSAKAGCRATDCCGACITSKRKSSSSAKASATQAGRTLAAGGRDPAALWERPWDGWWRQIIFDLPVGQHRARASLIRWLRRERGAWQELMALDPLLPRPLLPGV